MVEPAARIRPFKPPDDKLARFIIGKAHMEGIAAANVRLYTNPWLVMAWFGLSAVFVQYMQWWPNYEVHGYLSYIRPLPAFACVAVPMLVLIDWYNRPYFEELTHHSLRGPDFKQLTTYYSDVPGSAFWILEFGEKFVGLIAVDASENASTIIPLFSDELKKESNSRSRSNQKSALAVIRHFYVEEQYRPAGIAQDLLEHALKQAFLSNDALKSVRAPDSPLRPEISKALKETGFKTVEGYSKTVGVQRWKVVLKELTRARWHELSHTKVD